MFGGERDEKNFLQYYRSHNRTMFFRVNLDRGV